MNLYVVFYYRCYSWFLMNNLPQACGYQFEKKEKLSVRTTQIPTYYLTLFYTQNADKPVIHLATARTLYNFSFYYLTIHLSSLWTPASRRWCLRFTLPLTFYAKICQFSLYYCSSFLCAPPGWITFYYQVNSFWFSCSSVFVLWVDSHLKSITLYLL